MAAVLQIGMGFCQGVHSCSFGGVYLPCSCPDWLPGWKLHGSILLLASFDMIFPLVFLNCFGVNFLWCPWKPLVISKTMSQVFLGAWLKSSLENFRAYSFIQFLLFFLTVLQSDFLLAFRSSLALADSVLSKNSCALLWRCICCRSLASLLANQSDLAIVSTSACSFALLTIDHVVRALLSLILGY